MKVTIDDVAKMAGVSKTTVSRILNGNYSQATEETKERVLKIIRDLNYRPNPMARGLKQMRTNIIGIVLSNLSNPFWSRVLEGVEDTCRLSGYSLMVCNSNEDSEREAGLIEGLQMRQVDGIIVNPTVNNKELYTEIVQKKYPLLVINRRISDLDVDDVVVDNMQGARLAVEHFIQMGRRRPVCFVYEPEGISTWQERILGFQEAMRDNGLEVTEQSVIRVENAAGRAKKSALDFFRQEPDADAIFSTNNMMTLEILEGLKELGIEVPGRIALIGYDETVWAKHLNPPLTTIEQPAYEMGRIAAKNLIQRIGSKTVRKPKHVVLKPNLIARSSSGNHSSS
ncbi:LacI family DNA-binding transcriptional regulator [Paenibacillus sp. GCM10023248]|uniref:LacI family DNA-binding transcriptional regulator n=1 Tax=Bacillales TaxID=1385 RepID=UPI0023794C3A|nr:MULTISPECIES: LacI family DNA-binding transcriptional regulator [Bacillales]MDD9269380.1 LacI family DNA-binding transcriptional regulator [Paenibacillus sp. MAHUQ-63]MDR6881000.1 DNA-binding LacI/PurR family transcriptional regulator [Bacillus sp. 3255]